MPRIPVRVLSSLPQGTTNPAVVTGRSVAPPTSLQRGPAQPRQHFTDRQQNRAQTAVAQAIAQAKARPDADQLVIPGVPFLPEVPTVIRHGLGRAFVGYYVTNVRPTTVGSVPYSLGFVLIPNLDTRLDAFQLQVQSLTLCTGDVTVY